MPYREAVTDPELRRRLREAILGEPVYTVDELMAGTGTARTFADDLWLALGFPLGVVEDATAYGEVDAQMLRSLNDLLAFELVPPEKLLAMTRVMGQAMARLASAQVQLFDEEMRVLVTTDDGLVDDEVRARVLEMLVPGVERFVTYTWRRHLAAALDRSLDVEDGATQPVVGFVDLVDFTRTTRQLAEPELASLVNRFERHVYESITNSGARLRKLLGDGVMFDAPDVATGAGAALALVMRCAEDPHLTGARGGLAAGPTLEMEGDLYGETVNRASRLAAMARPNTVLADAGVAETLTGQPGFALRPLGPRSVKGLGKVDVSVVRPALM